MHLNGFPTPNRILIGLNSLYNKDCLLAKSQKLGYLCGMGIERYENEITL